MNKYFFIFLYIGIINAVLSLIGFFLPLYFKYDIFLNGKEIGFLMGIISLVGLITVVPIGIFNDRITPKKFIRWALLLLIAMNIGFIYIESFWFAIPLALLAGLGISLFNISHKTLVLKKGSTVKKSVFFGYFMMVYQCINAIIVILACFLLESFAFKYLLMVLAGILGLMFLISKILPPTQTVEMPVMLYKKDLMRPKVFFLILIFFLFAIHYGAETTSYTLFLIEHLDLSRIQAGYYMATENIFLGISAFFFGREIDRGVKLKTILYYGLIFSAIGSIGMVIVPTVWQSVLFRIIHGIGDGAVILLMFVGITKLFIPDRYGGHAGLVSLSTILGASIGAFVFGPIGSTFGYGWPLLISGISTGLVFLLSLWYKELVSYSQIERI